MIMAKKCPHCGNEVEYLRQEFTEYGSCDAYENGETDNHDTNDCEYGETSCPECGREVGFYELIDEDEKEIESDVDERE
jgi:uncharacterized protein (UPF0212 family)